MTESYNPIAETSEVIPRAILLKLYFTMLRIRRFEEKVAELLEKRPSITCPVHLYIGQEAVAAGVCANLTDEDYVFSTHRSHGHYIAKGGDIRTLMAELFCRATGCSGGRGGSMHLTSPDIGFIGSSAIVAGTIPLAVGTALAFRLQKKSCVSVSFFGDGAIGEGVFYESLNLASLKKLPVVFICENNLYSTHMHVTACLADTEIYRKADMFGIPGLRIDGNNVVEVFLTARTAIERARQGKGPTLIECMTYRWRGHVGPNYDMDKGLRSKEELDKWIGRCPVKTVEQLLLKEGTLSEIEKNKIYQDTDFEIEKAVAFARESPYPDKEELLQHLFRS